ncbi:MAG: hypothetical protein PHX13_10360 [Thiovulaceae bacterium]|nr:hypothetical protein [Sulfurimonadaceae bacterium]
MSDIYTAYGLTLFFSILTFGGMRIYFTTKETLLFMGGVTLFFIIESYFYPPFYKMLLLDSIVMFLMASYLGLFRAYKQMNSCFKEIKEEDDKSK